MMLLQAVEPAQKVLDQAFGLNPDSVFGFLVALLILIMLALTTAIVYLWRDNNKTSKEMTLKYEQLAQNTVTVIQNNVAVLSAMKDALTDLADKTPDQIRELEGRVINAVQRSGDDLKSVITTMLK